MPKCDFKKVTVHLYWNRTFALVISCKFAGYFQNNTFIRTVMKGCFCIPESCKIAAHFYFLISDHARFPCDFLEKFIR